MLRKILKIVLYIVVVLLFIYLLINTNFKEIWVNLKSIPIYVIILLVILQCITQIVLAYQWYRITSKFESVSFKKIFYILCTGSVIESITPGAKIGGEVTRLINLKKEVGLSTDKATSIIVIQKSISMSVLFLICLISFTYLCFNISLDISILSKVLINIFCVILIMVFILLLFFPSKFIKIFEKSNKKICIKISSVISSYIESTKLLIKKEWIIQFIISIFVWVLFPIKMLILCYVVGIDLNFMVIIAITMSAYMIGTLPITPGGIGTFEGSMVALFSLVSIESSISASISIIFRVITFWFVMILSSLYVLFYKRGGCNERED